MKWKVTLRQTRYAEVEVDAPDSDAAYKMLEKGELPTIEWELDDEYVADVEEAE